MAALYLPGLQPPGAGLVLGGRVHSGAGGFAGELGYLPAPERWHAMDLHDPEIGALAEFYAAVLLCAVAPDQLVIYGALPEAAQRQVQGALARRYAGLCPAEVFFLPDIAMNLRDGVCSLALQTVLEAQRSGAL